MEKLNKFPAIIALLFLLTSGLSAQEPMIIDKVIARVGTEYILISDVESQYSFQAKRMAIPDPALKCDILQSIIAQKLIVHQARLDSIEVGADQLEASLDFRIESVLRQMNGDEARFEEYYGMTINEMRDNLRSDLEQQMLAEQMQTKILNEVDITPKEVKEFFSSIPKDSIPYLNAEVELSEIVIAPEVNSLERAKALQQIIDIRKKILSGEETFEDMASVYSDDPGSATRGGDLGYAKRGLYVQEFEGAAFGLDEGEISDPVESIHGFHIIKMIDRRGQQIRVKHILVKPNITQADLDLAVSKLDTLKQRIENGELTFEAAVRQYSNKEVPSYHNNGRIINPETGATVFETAELPSAIYFAIEEMAVDSITEPLDYPLPSGETYYRIIKLISKTKPHRASLEQDYTKILNFAKQSKKNEYFTEWLEEKLGETYVELDRQYMVCPDLDALLAGEDITSRERD